LGCFTTFYVPGFRNSDSTLIQTLAPLGITNGGNTRKLIRPCLDYSALANASKFFQKKKEVGSRGLPRTKPRWSIREQAIKEEGALTKTPHCNAALAPGGGRTPCGNVWRKPDTAKIRLIVKRGARGKGADEHQVGEHSESGTWCQVEGKGGGGEKKNGNAPV